MPAGAVLGKDKLMFFAAAELPCMAFVPVKKTASAIARSADQ